MNVLTKNLGKSLLAANIIVLAAMLANTFLSYLSLDNSVLLLANIGSVLAATTIAYYVFRTQQLFHTKNLKFALAGFVSVAIGYTLSFIELLGHAEVSIPLLVLINILIAGGYVLVAIAMGGSKWQ